MIKNKLSQFLLPLVLTGTLLTACDSDAHPLVIGSNSVGNNAMMVSQQSDSLTKAIASGDLPTVKQLVEGGASIDLDDQGINQPIRIAVKKGQVRILRYLLERGARMETERSRAFRRVGINGVTATNVLSSISDEPEMLELLLQYGAKPNLVGVGADAADHRPLLVAVRQGNLESVQILLDYGADPNLGGESPDTALGWALALEHKKILKALLRGGANANIFPSSDDGGEPLSLRKACRLSPAKRPLPPLDLALQQGRHEFADMLKDAGARTSEQLCGEYS